MSKTNKNKNMISTIIQDFGTEKKTKSEIVKKENDSRKRDKRTKNAFIVVVIGRRSSISSW